MAQGTVHPPELAETLAELRVHPEELTASHIAPFVPDLEKIDQTKDQRLLSIAKITAEASSMHAAATWIMENQPWDFLAVYYDAIDHYCHGFMKFHPPHREGIPRDLYDFYHGVVEGGYRFHDMMLERLLQLAGDDTTVIICSDHGFHPDHLRPIQLPQEPAGPAAEHSPYGMIAMRGPAIKQDQLIYGSTLLDITPTILTLFDLPTAHDMEGRPLLQAFKQAPDIKVIDSWEEVAGDCGMHDVDA
jgi:predicted AlkP superfamily phosphohydrolase/phosphomutase